MPYIINQTSVYLYSAIVIKSDHKDRSFVYSYSHFNIIKNKLYIMNGVVLFWWWSCLNHSDARKRKSYVQTQQNTSCISFNLSLCCLSAINLQAKSSIPLIIKRNMSLYLEILLVNMPSMSDRKRQSRTKEMWTN